MLLLSLFAVGTSLRSVNAAETVPAISGDNSYIDLGTPAALQIPSGEPFTVEGWMYLNVVDAGTSGRDMLYSKNNHVGSPYTYMFGFRGDNGTLAAYTYDPETARGWREADVPGGIESHRWYHMAFSFDGSDISLYLDGELLGVEAFDFVNDPALAARIGGYLAAADINGMYSDFRVWNVARTQTEIRNNMNSRLTGVESGLVGYWPLNDGAGTSVTDLTANENSGTMINASWTTSDDLSLARLEFSAAHPITGSTLFTNTNKLNVTSKFPSPYNAWQITQDGNLPSGSWGSTSTPPTTVEFTAPTQDDGVVLTLWATNLSFSVPVRSNTLEITYTTVTPDLAVNDPLNAYIASGAEAVIMADTEASDRRLDAGSSGGEYDGMVLNVHTMSVARLSGPGADLTPNAPYVTLDTVGTYELELAVMNEAGGTTTTSATVTVSTAGTTTRVGGTNWFTADNWSYGVPSDGQHAIVNDGDMVLPAPSANLASFTLNGGSLTFSNWTTALTANEVSLNAGEVTAAGPFLTGAMSNRVWIVCSDLTVASGAAIDVGAKGYAGGNTLSASKHGQGPGRGRANGYEATGAGHGGRGGSAKALTLTHPWEPFTYGSETAPLYPGSGGATSFNYAGAGGHGGGAVQIETTGTVTVEGSILANGQNAPTVGSGYRNGGGSGGAIYVTCAVFQGADGELRADGGDTYQGITSYHGGGGGGRIAVRFGQPMTENLPQSRILTSETAPDAFSGSVSVAKGIGNQNVDEAEAGTIRFLRIIAPRGTLLLLH